MSGSARAYARDLRRFGGRRLVALFVLTLAAALTDGIGLLLLVPLLELTGAGGGSGISRAAGDALGAMGIPLTLRALLAVYVALIAARAALTWARTVRTARFQLELVDWQRSRVFEAIARADWLYQLGRRESDVVHGVANDIARVGAGTNAVLSGSTKVVVAAVYGVIALRLSAAMTAITVVFSLGLSLAFWPLVRRSRELGGLQTTTGRRVVAAISDLLTGMKVAKVHGAERQHLDEFRTSVAEMRRAQVGFQRIEAFATAAQQVATAAGLAVVVVVGVEVLEVRTAELLALIVVMSRILPVAGSVMTDVRSAVNMLPAYDAAMRTLAEARAHEERPVARGRPWPVDEAIELRGVRFRHPSAATPAVDGVDLVIPARATTALVGPSGAGKTTLADVVLGLLRPDEGEVVVDGTALEAIDLGRWRATVAYVPQDPFLFHRSIRENVAWPDGDRSDEEITELLALVGLGDMIAALPDGLSTVVGERGHRLSGGERQRVVLARALGRRPQLLVLDEATSHLDTESELSAKAAIDAVHGGCTVLVIAHRLATVRDADQIVVLEDGRVTEVGTWASLAAGGGRFHEMVRAGEA